MFSITSSEISTQAMVQRALNHSCGAVVTFEGRVRDHNFGRRVVSLEYEVYPELAISEGKKILSEAATRYEIEQCLAEHRFGLLELGDIAVSIVVVSSHREAAFLACRYIIDEIKIRLPIWKKEHYSATDSAWVECPGCKHATEARKNAGSIFQTDAVARI